MREPLRDRERLQHILSAIDRVQRYTDGKTYEELVGNDLPELREQIVKYLNETDWSQWEQNNNVEP